MKLHRFIPAIVAAVALSACADLNNAVTFTQTDITNAIAIDNLQAANPNANVSAPAMVKLSCDLWIQANLTTIQNEVMNAPPVTGFFSGTSAAQAVAANFAGTLSQAQIAAFNAACGGEVLYIEGLPASFLALGIIK